MYAPISINHNKENKEKVPRRKLVIFNLLVFFREIKNKFKKSKTIGDLLTKYKFSSYSTKVKKKLEQSKKNIIFLNFEKLMFSANCLAKNISKILLKNNNINVESLADPMLILSVKIQSIVG